MAEKDENTSDKLYYELLDKGYAPFKEQDSDDIVVQYKKDDIGDLEEIAARYQRKVIMEDKLVKDMGKQKMAVFTARSGKKLD